MIPDDVMWSKRKAIGWKLLLLFVITPSANAHSIAQEIIIRPNSAAQTSQAISLDEQADPDIEPQPSETWELIFMGDRKIGHRYTRWENDNAKPFPTESCVIQENVRMLRFGTPWQLAVTTHASWRRNQMVSASYQQRIGAETQLDREAILRAGKLQVVTRESNRARESETDVSQPIIVAAALPKYLKRVPMKVGERRTYAAYFPASGETGTLRLSARSRITTKMWDGRRRELLPVELFDSTHPDGKMRLFLSETGVIMKSETDILDSKITSYQVSREAALEEFEISDFDAVLNVIVTPNVPLELGHGTRRATYKLTLESGDPSRLIPLSATQKIQRIDIRHCLMRTHAFGWEKNNAPSKDANTNEAMSDYLQPSAIIDFHDPQVRNLASRAATNRLDQRAKVRQLQTATGEWISTIGFSSLIVPASRTVRDREGDCTEHAILLCALLRSHKIPARVAVGLVYSELHGAFLPHMWTEAFVDGKWALLDATQYRQKQLGAAYIKLFDHSLNGEDVNRSLYADLIPFLGHLEIEIIEQE